MPDKCLLSGKETDRPYMPSDFATKKESKQGRVPAASTSSLSWRGSSGARIGASRGKPDVMTSVASQDWEREGQG